MNPASDRTLARVNLFELADFILEPALGKFAVGGVEAVMNELALVPIACIIHAA